MKKILITGGAGFLGSHLCERLLDDGNEVTCLDDLSTGSLDNIKSLIGRTGFRWVEGNVQEYRAQYDEIYNLACAASPKAYRSKPVDTTLDCVLGAVNMLSLVTGNAGKVLQASTSEVYGEPLEHPRQKNIGATSTQSARDHATTRASA